MKLESMDAVYAAQLKDLYSTEKQLAAALPKLAEAASNEQLKQGFQAHAEQTQDHVQRLDKVFERLGVGAGRKRAKGIAALIEEAQEIIEAKGDAGAKDAALIGAAQRTEHYEMSIYGTAVALAKQLGKQEDVQELEATLAEEKDMDRRLSSLALGEVNPSAEGETSTDTGSGQDTTTPKGSDRMARDYDDDDRGSRGGRGGGGGGGRGYTDSAGRHYSRESWERAQEGRSLGGQHSHGGRSGGGYDDDDDRGGYGRSSSRGSSSRSSSYDDDDRGSRGGRGGGSGGGGGYTDSAGRHYSRESWERAQEGRALGGQHSHGGYGNEDDDRGSRSSSRGSSYSSGGGSSRGDGGGRGRYDNDNDDRFGSYDGRSRGGRHSADMQERNEYGQFAGYGGSSSGGGRSSRDDDDDRGGRFSGRRGSSGGGRSSSYDDDDRYDGRSRGGRSSAEMQERDEYGQFAGYSGGGGNRGGGGRSRDDDDDRGGRSGGGRSGGGRGGRSGYDD